MEGMSFCTLIVYSLYLSHFSPDNSSSKQNINSDMTAAGAASVSVSVSVSGTNLVGALSTASGSVAVVANPHLSTTVLKARLAKVTETASRNLEEECKISMDKPITALSERFS